MDRTEKAMLVLLILLTELYFSMLLYDVLKLNGEGSPPPVVFMFAWLAVVIVFVGRK